MQPLQEQVGDDGQEADQDGADDQHRHVTAADGRQNQYPQAAGADGGGDGHDTDVHHHGGADTGEDHRHRDGQLDHAQALAEGHADASCGFADTRFDTGQGQVGVAHDRQQGVEEHGGDRRQRSRPWPNLE